MPDKHCLINARVTKLEVEQENDASTMVRIEKNQSELSRAVHSRLDRENGLRWKMVTGVLAALFLICIGLIAFIYTKGIG